MRYNVIVILIIALLQALPNVAAEVERIGSPGDLPNSVAAQSVDGLISSYSTSYPNCVLPKAFHVSHNYPSPFNGVTIIKFELATETGVFAAVFSVMWRNVTTLAYDVYNAGSYRLTWGGTDNYDQPVATGVYFRSPVAEGNYALDKIMLIIY